MSDFGVEVIAVGEAEKLCPQLFLFGCVLVGVGDSLFFSFLWVVAFFVGVGEWFVKCVETFHLVVVCKRPVFVFRALTVFCVSG